MACKTTWRGTQFFLRAIAILALAAIFFPSAAAHAEDKPAADPAKKFDHVGPQPGDQMPDVPLRTLKDEPMSLRTVCEHRPTLLVTSSFTCPKSRSRWPELQDLAAKYEGQLQVVIVYVIEAHPTDDICPYKGIEDVTEENRRDGILRRQPKTLEVRLDLANEFRSHLGVKVPIYVDTMKNTAWTALGAAPNLALLVRKGGKVEHRQGWFSAEDLEPAVDKFLESLAGRERPAERSAAEKRIDARLEELNSARIVMFEVHKIFRENDVDRLTKLLDELPGMADYVPAYFGRGHTGGRPLLSEAVDEGTLKHVELLVARGADVNAQTEYSPPPLQLAAAAGKRNVVEFLVGHGADVNLADRRTGNTALRSAVNNEHRDIVGLLLKAGAKEDFFTRCGMGKLEEVRRELDADPAKAFIGNPLGAAAATDQVAVLSLLIECGAVVKSDDESLGFKPIHTAAEHGHAHAARVLLNAGASPDSRLYWEGTPLHIAIKKGYADVAQALIDGGADLTIRDIYSETPLHLAAFHGKTAIVKAILAAKGDPSPVTESYSLPCGGFGDEDNATRDTPMHLAAGQFHAETAAALIAGGAKIDPENAAGVTPLAVAVMSTVDQHQSERVAKRLETVRVLVAGGASTQCVDRDGKPVREVLKKAGDTAVLNLLDRR